MALRDMMDEITSGLEADMDDAPQNHPGMAHDSSATLIAPDADASPDDATAENAPDEKPTSSGSLQSSLQRFRRGQRTRFVRMAIIAVTLAALALLLPSLIASTARRPAAQIAPTQAPPTATASPAPTLISGFQFVSDAEAELWSALVQCSESQPHARRLEEVRQRRRSERGPVLSEDTKNIRIVIDLVIYAAIRQSN